MAVKLLHLYPKELNLYGDVGNLLCLKRRIEARGYATEIIEAGVGDTIPDFDIMLIGGGQDREMRIIQNDVRRKAEMLSYSVHCGKTILAICGGYQLLGQYYKTDTDVIRLSCALPFYTVSGDERMIGNFVFNTPFGRVVGFENHSGRTFLCNGLKPLGELVLGYGNNGYDCTEGLLYKNTFCTYSHGPVLPKNPHLADEIISRILGDLEPIDDGLELNCYNNMLKRLI